MPLVTGEHVLYEHAAERYKKTQRNSYYVSASGLIL